MSKDGSSAADTSSMSTVTVSIGPVPGPSARAWLETATITMSVVRDRPDLGVPADVIEAFEHYLAEWRAVVDLGVFQWSGEVQPGVLRRLASHWVRLAALAREDPDRTGIRPGDPESEQFFDALAVGMAEALARVDDRERFAPKFEEVVPEFAAAPSPKAASAAPNRRVLLVDDNPDIRLLVRIGLEASGGFSAIREACDGREALDALAVECPDVVLLDLSMPVMDGFEALPLLKERCPESRVVIYSASDSPSTRQRIEASGGDAYLRKDAGIADVVNVLRTV